MLIRIRKTTICFLRGATAYEASIGRMCVRVLRPRFWGCGPLVKVWWATEEG